MNTLVKYLSKHEIRVCFFKIVVLHNLQKSYNHTNIYIAFNFILEEKMDTSIATGIINNAILLLGLGILYSLIPLDNSKNKLLYKISIGAIISIIVVFIMTTPFEIATGVVLDTRSILISLAALFFGPIPGIIVIISASTLRIIQGGAGALTGVLVIISSGIIGYLFRKYRFDKIKNRKVYRLLEIYLFGLTVHLFMLLLFFVLPKDIRIPILKDISFYVLLIYPIVTVLYSALMFIRYDNYTSNKLLIQSKHNFVIAIEETPVPVVIHADDGEVLTVNKAWTDLSGYSKKDIPTTFDWIRKAYGKDKYEKAVKNVAELFNTTNKIHEGEIKIMTKSGETKTWDFYSNALGKLPDGRKTVLSIATDVTDRRMLEQKLITLSYHDELTGLYNRRFYEEELHRLNTKRNYPLTLLMGDVNGLKIINDSFGHISGDELLKTAAEVFNKVCRKDDIITRLGGDEFIILLPKTNLTQADKMVTRIKKELATRKIESINISISFGHASITSEEQDIGKVFVDAENAMYQKKLLESPSIRGFAIDIILRALFEINPELKFHSENVSKFAVEIAEKMKLSHFEIQEVKTASLLHDIGKIVTPVSILTKEGKLTVEEYEEIKKHPERGYRILCSGPNMENIANYCLFHHEKYDGSGYPNGLSGNQIPLQSRIISLADSYDAMINERTYKQSLSNEQAIQEIKDNMGTQFDPNIAKIFIEEILEKS